MEFWLDNNYRSINGSPSLIINHTPISIITKLSVSTHSFSIEILISVAFVEACLVKVGLYKEQNLSFLLSCSEKLHMLLKRIQTE